jgi:glycosyltransferase involved in cell wall biosynthesis
MPESAPRTRGGDAGARAGGATGAEPFRIVCVVDGFNVGGAERALLALLARLDRHRFRRVVFSTGREGPLQAAYRDTCDRVESHPKRFAFDASLIARLARVLHEERPHVCLSVLFYADVIAALAARRAPVPLVSWQHVLPSRDLKNRRFYHRLAARTVLPRFTTIVCCADCVRDDLASLYRLDPARLVTVHNGVDLRRFAFQEPRQGPFRIGMLARFDPEKRHADLLQAVARLRESVPAVRVVLAGDGPTRADMQALARQLGLESCVEFPGVVADAEQMYPTFDVVVLTSAYEAHPVTLLEALACGRPVVASDVPGVREAVAAGEDALLYPPGDVAALAAALADLARDPERRATMGRAGRAHVERAFALETQNARLLAELERAAGKGAAADRGAGA